jgi:hypothetical protein
MTKKPQPNEWWETNAGERVFFACDVSQNGIMVEYPCVVFIRDIGGKPRLLLCSHSRVLESCVKHLPSCTGFDWVEPPVVADPNEERHRHYMAEQLGICPGVQKPVESPDDWVTQDRVPFRYKTDQFRWVDRNGSVIYDWATVESSVDDGVERTDGETHPSGDRFEVRCRRKDLPPLKEVLPGPIESYTTIEGTAPLQNGDLLVDGGLCYAVPPQYLGTIAKDVKISGYEDVFFLRDKFITPPKAEPVDPALVLETVVHMRDQVALLAKRVEKLESMHPTNFAESR